MSIARSLIGLTAAAILLAAAVPAPAQQGGEVIDARISAKRRADRDAAKKRQEDEQKKAQQQKEREQKKQAQQQAKAAAAATPAPGGPPKPGAPAVPGKPVGGKPTKPGAAAKAAPAPSTVGQAKEISHALVESTRTRKIAYDEEEYSQRPGVVILGQRKYEAEKSLLERQENREPAQSSIAQPL